MLKRVKTNGCFRSQSIASLRSRNDLCIWDIRKYSGYPRMAIHALAMVYLLPEHHLDLHQCLEVLLPPPDPPTTAELLRWPSD